MPIRPLFTLEEGLKPKIGSALSANFSSILRIFLFSLYLVSYINFRKFVVLITRQIDLRLVLALAIGVGQRMCRMRYHVILACTL